MGRERNTSRWKIWPTLELQSQYKRLSCNNCPVRNPHAVVTIFKWDKVILSKNLFLNLCATLYFIYYPLLIIESQVNFHQRKKKNRRCRFLEKDWSQTFLSWKMGKKLILAILLKHYVRYHFSKEKFMIFSNFFAHLGPMNIVVIVVYSTRRIHSLKNFLKEELVKLFFYFNQNRFLTVIVSIWVNEKLFAG